MNTYVWSVILFGAVVTVIPRILPITIMSKIKLHPKLEEFLKWLPIDFEVEERLS